MAIRRDVPLAQLNNYRIGGPARYFFDAHTPAELKEVLQDWKGELFILGGGTNVLVSDSGFSGLVLKPALGGIKIEGDRVYAGAGVSIAELLEALTDKGLSGLEWAGGLPGTVGGAIRGNAGAFGGEAKDTVALVESLDTQKLAQRTRSRDECDFAYRSSIFKRLKTKEIILGVVFQLRHGDRGRIHDAVQEKIAYRTTRHPLEYPNIGSIFKNVPVERVPEGQLSRLEHAVKRDPFPIVPVAYLITEAGLKGVSFGGAMISPKHPNFIVNVCNAAASDVEALIELVKSEVKRNFGIEPEEEVERVGFRQSA